MAMLLDEWEGCNRYTQMFQPEFLIIEQKDSILKNDTHNDPIWILTKESIGRKMKMWNVEWK